MHGVRPLLILYAASLICASGCTDGMDATVPVPVPVLSLVAGGIGGAGNLDGVGTAARFNGLTGAATDGAGNLYIADNGNQTIRKVTLATGAVTTLAGSAGMTGTTDGTGVVALFRGPTGVAVDAAGNLYVSDSGNHTIRKVDVTTRAVSTFVGIAGTPGGADGVGTAATFNFPGGVAVDSAGNLYVADTRSNTIRKVVLATRAVSTLAGNAGMTGSTDGIGAAARFDRPNAVAIDGTGNLYVSDFGNSTIRKVVVATSVVSTLAGKAQASGSTDGIGAAARFNWPTGVAVDVSGNLYVSESGNHTIRKVVVTTGAVTTLAGAAGMVGSADGTGAAALFTSPSGVAMDGVGNVYVLESNTIRKVVVTTGTVTTLAGSASMAGSTDGTGSAAKFGNPRGVAADGAGNLYVSDGSESTIRKVVAATGVVTTVAGAAGLFGSADGTGTSARFGTVTGVAVDGAGNLYVADSGNCTIRKVVTATGVVSTLAGTPTMRGSTDGTGTAARFNGISGVATDSAGNLYVSDFGNSTIRKLVIETGAVTTLAGTAGMTGGTDGTGASARFNGPTGVAVDGAGNLYVADGNNHTIRKVVLVTGTVTTLAGLAGMAGSADGAGTTARFNGPDGVSMDSAGNLYVSDFGNSTVRKVVVATGMVSTLVGIQGQRGILPGPLPAGLNRPRGVFALPTGQLFIADGTAVLTVH